MALFCVNFLKHIVNKGFCSSYIQSPKIVKDLFHYFNISSKITGIS